MKGSERTIPQPRTFVLSLPFASFRTLSLFVIFLLLSALHSPFSTLQAQCGVKVKSGDEDAMRSALAEMEQGHLREASQQMRRVAQRNPKAAEPQFWLGMLAVRNGFNATGIRKYFTKCIDLCPNYPNALAHYYMGMIYYTDERYEEATAELETYFRMANNCDDKAQTTVYEEASAYLHWSRFLGEAVLNMAPFDPEPLRGVSTKRNENLPFITPDGQRCYYLREMPKKKGPTSFTVDDLEQPRWTLFCSEWKDSAFSAGRELPAPFNQGSSEGGVSTTADGDVLYFSRITYTGGYANCDLYVGEWKTQSGKWEVERLGNNINGDRTWESQPSVSADGQWLYYASNRKGGQGGTDIWRCHRLKNGDWSRPENLGSRVNTAGNEKFPFIHADGHTLYFVSDGWQGFGGYDVYFIDLADGDAQPTNLGLPINTEDDELSFGVTADGTRAYFPGRVKSSRSKDILVFDLYPAARPEPMRCCHVQVEYSGREKSVRKTLMLSNRRATALTFAEEGLMPVILCATGKTWREGATVTLQDSTSALDLKLLPGSRLSEHDELLLDAWAEWLIDHPQVHVAVECPTMPEAKAVCDYLRNKKKLRAERLECRGGTQYVKRQIRLL